MFGLGKKRFDENFDADLVITTYRGKVSVGNYVPDNLNRSKVNQTENPSHLMVPDGEGKISYKIGEELIEEYEREVSGALYQGIGELAYRGKVFVGQFDNREFVG